MGGGKAFDWDFRPGKLSTAEAARGAAASRPAPDGRGVISYPGYQVAVARRGDTVSSLAARVGVDAGELARYNAVQPGNQLRDGEIMALPRRVAESAPMASAATGGITGGAITGGAITGGAIKSGAIDVSSVAGNAINKAAPKGAPQGWQTGAASASQAPGVEPTRHQVQRGETAFTIARAYNVAPKDLANWNSLDANLSVREGQYLLIPVMAAAPVTPVAAAVPEPVTAPGAGSPTPVPPSAAKPLPAVDEPPVAAAPKVAAGATTAAPGAVKGSAVTPAAPAPKPVADLGATRSTASGAKFGMPVSGQIIRGYSKGRNDGIDIGASAGTSVAAAGDGTVAAITKNTDGVPILVIRHADNLLTVYGGIDAVAVSKGATVKRGQSIAKVRAGSPAFLHFEVRKGFDSVDPTKYLQ
ncbi:peptidoglycan DD-metalloendopeptidase family protein [Gemmobacter sp.]|uniref:peptidoglycan DD-metalloendopeptidase family protein n=1 Tax=Gemmobacter sp. TaxID=1898957 RepID=UPI0025BAFC28|nr:peptidoglycan DD-metalloendopeptidase family protein [Gemmobacter sp.]